MGVWHGCSHRCLTVALKEKGRSISPVLDLTCSSSYVCLLVGLRKTSTYLCRRLLPAPPPKHSDFQIIRASMFVCCCTSEHQKTRYRLYGQIYECGRYTDIRIVIRIQCIILHGMREHSMNHESFMMRCLETY